MYWNARTIKTTTKGHNNGMRDDGVFFILLFLSFVTTLVDRRL
jgi:hypothetical protein